MSGLPPMEQYRIYLKAELGKLRSVKEAGEFLARSGCRLQTFGLTNEAEWLAGAFASQDGVDIYVDSLPVDDLKGLTGCCGRWRGNGIEHLLKPA